MEINEKSGLIIPSEMLSTPALIGLIDEFILREGTDYGDQEYTLEQKREKITKQLDSGKIVILFDPEDESTNLVKKEEALKIKVLE